MINYNMRIIILSFLMIFTLLPLTACNEDETLMTVKIAQFGKEKFLLYLPLYVAMEEGIFEKNGIKIDLKFAGNGDQVFSAVASGHVDFGVADPVFSAIAQEKGFPAKTVAMMITNLGLSGYTNNPEIPVINHPTDLAGLRIGSFPAPSTAYTLLNELKENYADQLKDTKIVETPFGSQVALVEADKVDIAVDIEPTVSIVEAEGYRVVLSLKDFVEKQAITGLTVTQETIDNRPEMVELVVRSLQEAMDMLHGKYAVDVALRVGEKIYPNLEKDIIRTAVTRIIENEIYPVSVVVKDEYWQRTLKTRLDSGELKKPQPTDMAVDNSFALKAQGR